MGHYKDGKPDRLQISWHKNGHKWSEETRKDGRMVSAKYWNRKGEEVRTLDEARN
jgi:antitoxin component YwqK of YwqJK toxin-antitoxin module